MVTVSGSPSSSTASRRIWVGSPDSAGADWSVATGTEFVTTLIEKLATFESASPSFAFQVKASEPVYPPLGVYVQSPAEQSLRMPCDGPDTTAYVSGSK